MNKRDLIKHLKSLLEIEEKELSIEQYNYFSPEIEMWRKRFLRERHFFDIEVTEHFLAIPSENLMKKSVEDLLSNYEDRLANQHEPE